MNILHIVSIICFAFCLVIFFYLKWYVKKRTSSFDPLEKYRAEVGMLIAEIDKVTDRDSQLVEDRINQLKKILEEADMQISVYMKELEKIRAGDLPAKLPAEALYTSLGKGIRAALSANTAAEKNSQALQPVLFPVMPHIVSPQAAAPPAPEEPVKKTPSKKQIRAHIDLLLDEGIPPEKIAERLEISVAEVNLAVNLRRVKKK